MSKRGIVMWPYGVRPVARLRLIVSLGSAAAAPGGEDRPPITVTRPMVSVSYVIAFSVPCAEASGWSSASSSGVTDKRTRSSCIKVVGKASPAMTMSTLLATSRSLRLQS